jgi:hypothetical protein
MHLWLAWYGVFSVHIQGSQHRVAPLESEPEMRALIAILLMLGVTSAVPAAPGAFHLAVAEPRAVLREVERAETAYRAERGRYTASLSALRIERVRGVDVRIVAEGAAGYSAVAIADAEECAVYHGRARPPRNWVRAPERIVCRGR